MTCANAGVQGSKVKVKSSSNQEFHFCGIKVYGYQTQATYTIPGKAVTIGVDSQGELYLLNNVGEIYHKRDSATAWAKQSYEGAKDIALSPSNKIWKIGRSDAKPYLLNGSSWSLQEIQGSNKYAADIAVGPSSTWVVDMKDYSINK